MADEDGLLPVGLAPEGENDDDTRADAAALFGIDLGDGSAAPIDVDADGGEGATATANSNGSAPSVAGTGNTSKRKSPVWADFEEIYEVINGSRICTKAVCKMCKSILSARSAAGTGHLKRHQKSCRIKTDQRARVQSRLSYNPDGSVYNWDYKPEVARSELCRLIAKLDLPLGIGETDAWEEYIVRAHNPRFVKVSRQTTTRDLGKLFNERRNIIKNCVLSGASSVGLTLDIWSGNAKEDYISVVAHYVSADWELQKKLKYLKYWKDIPLLYSFAFILDPRARSQRRAAHPANITGKRKQAWGRIFGGPGASGVVGPSPASAPSPSLSTSAAACELSAYLDSDNVTAYEDDFDLLLWWRDHKLTYPVLSIMARDIMSVPVSTVSSESCFSLTGRILEERRRRLLPEHVEMLACIKDWELGERRLQHDVDNQELVDSFEHLYLDEDASTSGSGAPSASTSASVASGGS
ncbi:uncharacterized protein [Miscanthus floridulus]|uniref:uncharacterized protein isoform X2 n=1 Tax=Miscanthus floridulus TaxID=154761 RepID=UPI00345796D3